MIVPILLIFLGLQNANAKNTYGFYRDMNKKALNTEFTRRIFGGTTAEIADFPGTCLLSDSYLKPKCTGTIITRKFVITAAHCITPKLYYILYNTRNPKSHRDVAIIASVYQHPGFNYVVHDEGMGDDITQLYHDIGLAETRHPMTLDFPARRASHLEMMSEVPANILYSKVDVLGFGITSDSPDAEELLKVSLRLQQCERNTWMYCICGNTLPGERARGVCSGDSGGPVVLNGTLVGVTSMGPMECTSITADPHFGATSVFTLVSRYINVINDTINRKAGTLVMNRMNINSANSDINRRYLNGHTDSYVGLHMYVANFMLLLNIFQ